MRRITIIILLIQLNFYAFSQQDFKLVDADKMTSAFILNKYLGVFKDNYYFQYLIIKDKWQAGDIKTQGIGVTCVSKELKELEKFELSGTEKKEQIVETFFNEGITYLIASHKEDDKKVVKIYSYDLKGNRIHENELLKTKEKNEIQFDYSLDSSKIAIFGKPNDDKKKIDCIIDAVVIDLKGNIAWKKSFNLGNSQKKDAVVFKVKNDGSLCALVISFLEDDKYSYSLNFFNNNSVKTIKLVGNEYIGRPQMYETKNGFYITGFNYDIKKDIFINPFLIQVDDLKKELIVPKDQINKGLLTSLISNKFYKEKKGWGPYVSLVHAWTNGKGEQINIWEPSFLSTEQVGGVYWKYHEVGHYYIFTYNSNMKLIDIKVCPKELAIDVNQLVYPVKSYVVNDNLYIIYNEFQKNINLASIELWKKKGDYAPILRQYKLNGTIKDIKLDKNFKDQVVVPNASGITSNGDIIFYTGEFRAFKNKNFKMGLININAFK